MNLCIDIGNTRIKYAVFDGDKIAHLSNKSRWSDSFLSEIFDDFNIRRIIVSSTKNLSHRRIEKIQKFGKMVVLDHTAKLPIRIEYATPDTLGKDRIAAAVGASYLHPNTNCIIVDAGTCITMDFIDKDKNYLGGNISPGLRMRNRAMHEFTDQLPMVPLEFPPTFIGTDTTSALQNGILRGTISEIDTFCKSIIKKYGHSTVFFSGGDLKIFEEHLNFSIFATPNLVLIGLNEILKLND